jgi:PAS domain S-box-containing protein
MPETFRERSDLLQTTLDSIGDAVISTNADGQVTFVNRRAETLTGWTQAESLGRPLSDVLRLVDGVTRLPAEDLAARAIRDGLALERDNHAILIGRGGAEIPIEDSAAPTRDESGNRLGAVVVFRDVSLRKEAEEAQALLASIVASSDDAIVSKTLDGIIRSWNAGAQRLFGYTAEQAIGRPITMIIPAERLDEEHEILARISRGERVDHFETVRVTRDGRLIDLSLTVSPVRDGSGRIVGASKIARDISDRKRADDVIREADRRKDQFIALLAHELRNPLAPLRNGLQVMRLMESDPATMQQMREMMDRQLGHMVRLIDDLLDISRITQNKLELRRSRVLLSEVLTSAVETARPAIDDARHRFAISIPPEPIFLDADLTRLAQVFSNLLMNSAKYTKAGGEISLTVESVDNRVQIAVRDTGIGIPVEAMPQIFDMFSQVDRSIERTTGGLGIGLALVKALVEMHGGTVVVASAGEDRGSTFTVTLPALPRHSPVTSVSMETPHCGIATQPRRVLVVDDNRDSAESLAILLRAMGHDVRIAHAGLQGIEIARQFLPEAIFMDLGMPRLNGYDTTQRIRQEPWGQQIFIVALTGWGQATDRIRSQEAGCDAHLVKPVSLPDLDQVLSQMSDEPSPP